MSTSSSITELVFLQPYQRRWRAAVSRQAQLFQLRQGVAELVIHVSRCSLRFPISRRHARGRFIIGEQMYLDPLRRLTVPFQSYVLGRVIFVGDSF